jgi:predicted Rossmann fold flavoprotein
MKPQETNQFDVVVIGGGPAGMMAAGRAAERGAKVLLLEKNSSLGKKLLITGGGRCNITNNEPDVRKLLSMYKGNDKFLFSAFSQFAVTETLDFFDTHNLETKEEARKRMFPKTEKAESVWNALVEYMKEGGVTVLCSSAVKSINHTDGRIASVTLVNNKEIFSKSFVLATGGKSRPETGSTGEGFNWLKKLGHTVEEPSSALVPVTISDAWIKTLQGVSLDEVKITVIQNERKQLSRVGRILFTHFGLTGPTVLNMSKFIGEILKYDQVFISLDTLPRFDHGQLNQKLQDIFKHEQNKKIKNSLGELFSSNTALVIIEKSMINPDTACNSITREQRLSLIETIKNLTMEVSGLLGSDKAIITSGGVALEEVDFKTMRSRLFPNLYLIGDVLNVDRPSGGYSLQLCWTTGFVAGQSVDL